MPREIKGIDSSLHIRRKVRQEAERSISTNCGIDTLLNLTAKVLPVGRKK
ncbi:MAG TPA: hypothetical protein VK579_07575 [Terriglobales bacterium]|nr:hypothetical protein [Terriglobales bacterium]